MYKKRLLMLFPNESEFSKNKELVLKNQQNKLNSLTLPSSEHTFTKQDFNDEIETFSTIKSKIKTESKSD